MKLLASIPHVRRVGSLYRLVKGLLREGNLVLLHVDGD
jgi:hypothetical protein